MRKRNRSGVPLLVVSPVKAFKGCRLCNLSVGLALLVLCFVPLFDGGTGGVGAAQAAAEAAGERSRHNNNWAVLVRHTTIGSGRKSQRRQIRWRITIRATGVRSISSSVAAGLMFLHIWTLRCRLPPCSTPMIIRAKCEAMCGLLEHCASQHVCSAWHPCRVCRQVLGVPALYQGGQARCPPLTMSRRGTGFSHEGCLQQVTHSGGW